MYEAIYTSSDVYDAINMYQNCGKSSELRNNYIFVYNQYRDSGGTHTLKYFEDTIDDYNIQGICGY